MIWSWYVPLESSFWDLLTKSNYGWLQWFAW
jgi:hypothetical protein